MLYFGQSDIGGQGGIFYPIPQNAGDNKIITLLIDYALKDAMSRLDSPIVNYEVERCNPGADWIDQTLVQWPVFRNFWLEVRDGSWSESILTGKVLLIGDADRNISFEVAFIFETQDDGSNEYYRDDWAVISASGLNQYLHQIMDS